MHTTDLHSQAAKYIAAEIQKCTLDSGATAMGGKIDCDAAADAADGPTADNYAQAYVDSGVKNPYKPGDDGAEKGDAGEVEGLLYLTVTGDNIKLTMTSVAADDSDADNPIPAVTDEITITVE